MHRSSFLDKSGDINLNYNSDYNIIVEISQFADLQKELSRFITSCVSGRGNRIGTVFPSVCLCVSTLMAKLFNLTLLVHWDMTSYNNFWDERTVECTMREVHERSGIFISIGDIMELLWQNTQLQN